MSSTAKSWLSSLDSFINSKMLNVHTQLPAVVTKVGKRTVNCQPVVTTLYDDGSQDEYGELYDVPLLVLSANGGKTAIKMPIKVGDVVLVFFSERELGDFDGKSTINKKSYSLETHGLFPVGAFPCIFTSSVGEDIDPENIVIQNESTSIVVEPNGRVVTNTSSEYVVNAAKAVFNCPVEVVGGITNTGGITDDGVSIGSTHTHSGVQTGSGNTGGPT